MARAIWELTAVPHFPPRNPLFSKAHGPDGTAVPSPVKDWPRATCFSKGQQSPALSFCRKLNHFDGGQEGD